jgi:hypothetical protein
VNKITLKHVVTWMLFVPIIPGCDLIDYSGGGNSEWSLSQIKVFYSEEKPDFPIDPLQIHNVTISRDKIFLTVSYSGGCTEHTFELYGFGYFLESFPLRANVYLSHDAHNDMCDAIITREVMFGLSPLKRAYQVAYGRSGEFYLLIYEPAGTSPFLPLPLYRF